MIEYNFYQKKICPNVCGLVGKKFRAELLLLLLLESFIPECIQYSTTHSIGVSGLVYLEMDTYAKLLHYQLTLQRAATLWLQEGSASTR